MLVCKATNLKSPWSFLVRIPYYQPSCISSNLIPLPYQTPAALKIDKSRNDGERIVCYTWFLNTPGTWRTEHAARRVSQRHQVRLVGWFGRLRMVAWVSWLVGSVVDCVVSLLGWFVNGGWETITTNTFKGYNEPRFHKVLLGWLSHLVSGEVVLNSPLSTV